MSADFDTLVIVGQLSGIGRHTIWPSVNEPGRFWPGGADYIEIMDSMTLDQLKALALEQQDPALAAGVAWWLDRPALACMVHAGADLASVAKEVLA